MLQHTGVLKVKGETVNVSDKFKKREFVIQAEEQYPKPIQFQLTQDNVSLLDKFNVGDQVKVTFGLNGRKWNDPKDSKDKYFNSLDAFKLEAIGGASTF